MAVSWSPRGWGRRHMKSVARECKERKGCKERSPNGLRVWLAKESL